VVWRSASVGRQIMPSEDISMSENTNAADELLAQGQNIVSGQATDVIAAVPGIKDVQLLKAALIAENAGKVRVTVVAALEDAIKAIEAPAGNTNDTEGGKPPSTEGDLPPKDSAAPVTLVDMVLDEPQFEGGPTTAQVHPDEVQNYAAGGWKKEA
jgi:hypothetical protein